MAKQAEANATEQVASDIRAAGMTITPEIIALIAAAVASAVKEAGRDEDKEAAKARAEADRERVRQEEEERVARIKARQTACPHLDAYENYAFVGQRNCDGLLRFLCSQCFRPFHPSDPDYAHFVRFVKADRVGNARLM